MSLIRFPNSHSVLFCKNEWVEMYGFYWPSRAWLLAALVPSEDQCSPIQPITASDFHSHDRKNPRGNSPSYPKFLTKFFPWAIRGVTGNRVAGDGIEDLERKSYCTERFGENHIVQRDWEKERLEATRSHPRGKREAESCDRWNELWKLTFCGTEGPILGT